VCERVTNTLHTFIHCVEAAKTKAQFHTQILAIISCEKFGRRISEECNIRREIELDWGRRMSNAVRHSSGLYVSLVCKIYNTYFCNVIYGL
jgi:hypothetical protein